jgi:hypothetical protein
MGLTDPQAQFLTRIFELSAGDQSIQVSMYDIGAELGLDRDLAARTAEELIGSGLVEIRTLSGGIGMTASGITEVEKFRAGSSAGGAVLNNNLILSLAVRPTLEELLKDIKQTAGQWRLDAENASELFSDLQTLDAQLTSPRPKTGIIRETLLSLEAVMANTSAGSLHQRTRQLLGQSP